MKSRLAVASLVAVALGVSLLGSAGAEPTPLPTPSPIVVPSLSPADPVTQAIIRAAAGAINDVMVRSRLDTANNARGTVTYFRRFDMQVQTGTNAYRNVRLHQGTVINPRGSTPAVGSTVEVGGRGFADSSLEADVVTVIR